MKNLKLNCEICGVAYEKPAEFKVWNDERPNVFFRWSLVYCDTCRKDKQTKALQSLPKVINALSD